MTTDLPRHDPTYGQIDFDIQDHVDGLNLTSLGQRVAIERTLQDWRNDGAVVLGVHPEARPDAVDLVDHPPHYTGHPSGVECITITEYMSFNLGNAVKYVWRADLKGQALEDLKKAVWYIEREIARRQRSEAR